MILKTILTLSDERGFNVNKNLLDVNMSQELITAQRLVKDYMTALIMMMMHCFCGMVD